MNEKQMSETIRDLLLRISELERREQYQFTRLIVGSPATVPANGQAVFGGMVFLENDNRIMNDNDLQFEGAVAGAAGGIVYKDSGSAYRYGLWFPGSNIVRLGNRAASGVVQIAANNSTAGSGGEQIVGQFFAYDAGQNNGFSVNGRIIQYCAVPAVGAVPHGVIQHTFIKEVADNTVTTIFKVVTDDTAADAGHYHCFVDVMAMNNVGPTMPVGSSGETSTAHERFEWVRAMENGGTGVNSALSAEHGTPLIVSTAAATRDITSLTASLTEATEFDVRFRVTVNGAGTLPTPLFVLCTAELTWCGFEGVAPYMAAS